MISIREIFKLWNEYDFEIVVFTIIVFILLYALYNFIKGIKGTWTDPHDIKTFLYNNDRTYPYSSQQTPKRIITDSKGEVESRRILENIFHRPFNKIRPSFLNNPVTGGSFNMELDCFNEELQLAVEYSGAQHYKYTPFFHKNKEAFYNQKYRDELKKRMCKDEGITLIEIPYTVKHENIESYLINELQKYGYIN